VDKLSDYIIVVNNAVTSAVCDAVLNEYEKCDDWIDATVDTGANKNIRNCQTIGLSFGDVIQKNLAERQLIDKNIFKCAAEAIKAYRKIFLDCHIDNDYGYSLLRYHTGCFYKSHVDSAANAPRAVSCSFVLNDDYEGGEIQFPRLDGYVHKPKVGDIAIFPSNYIYEHASLQIKSGIKYCVVVMTDINKLGHKQ
jgi:predicted 2-oxoglutarate/Fe(II)-dependent dioxygenase YbiX